METTCTAQGPGHPQAQVPFKRYVDEQRKAVLDGIAYLKRVVATATNTDEPLLATSQAIDKVFAKYRSEAYSEEKAKFDE